MRILKFQADWCQPCRTQAEVLEGEDFGVEVTAIDIDDSPETATEYGVASIPTIILEDDDGDEVERWRGVTQPHEIREAIE